MKKYILSFVLVIFILLSTGYAAVTNMNINTVGVKTLSKTTEITITANAKIKDYEVVKLISSKKLYIDFKNAKCKISKSNIPVNKDYIKAVRSAQNQVKPEYVTRVVIDLEKWINYEVKLSPNQRQLRIIFDRPSTTVSRAPATTNKTSNRNNTAVAKKVVVLDPGHGGKDPGAVFSGVYEKTLNLDIADRTAKLLEKKGIKVYMTRENDEYLTLAERPAMAKSLNADLFISIHNNSMPANFKGSMVMYNNKNDSGNKIRNSEIAQIIQDNLVADVKTGDIGARVRNDLAVLKGIGDTPAALIEVACMSDSSDLASLKKVNFRQKAAQSIADSIVEVLKKI